MRKDPTEFRERFAKWKAGEKVYENGLPKYGDGTTNVIPEDLLGLSDPQFLPQIDAAKVQMTPFVVDDTAYRALKYHPGVTRELVQELYNNTPYIGSYNKGMLARPSVGAYFSDRDDYPFVRIGLNKPYSVKQMIAHESGHALDRKLFGGRTKEERDAVRAAYGNIPGMTDDEMFLFNREVRQAISENNRNAIKEKLDAVLKEIKGKDINWTIKNGKFGHADEAYKANIDPEAVRKALLEVAQNKYTFDKGNGIMLAKNGKSATLAIPQITNMQNGLPAYGGGKSTKKGPYVKGVISKPVYDEFDTFWQTLPDNQRALGAYNTRRYWELNGKPKDFAEAIGKGMYSVKNDNGVLNWHGNSVAYNEDNGTYEFMKPNYHPTRWMELVYGYDQSPEFQKDWKVQYNGPMLSDRYVRREKPGLKIKGGQLPRFAMGTDEDVDMGPKKQITSEMIEKVRRTAPHEQPLSGTDPIGEFYVRTVAGMKGAQLLGKYLTKLRLNRMADTYRHVRKYDRDVENYTGRNLRPQNIRFADEAAREQFLSRPSNPISAIGDFLAQGYTKLQGHPIIGPLIPF